MEGWGTGQHEDITDENWMNFKLWEGKQYIRVEDH